MCLLSSPDEARPVGSVLITLHAELAVFCRLLCHRAMSQWFPRRAIQKIALKRFRGTVKRALMERALIAQPWKRAVGLEILPQMSLSWNRICW